MEDASRSAPTIRFRFAMPPEAKPADAERAVQVFREQGGDADVEQGRRFVGAAEASFVVLAFIALPNLLRALREILDPAKADGVQIDLRTQPPTITPVPQLGTGVSLVIHPDGTHTRYPRDKDDASLLEALRGVLR